MLYINYKYILPEEKPWQSDNKAVTLLAFFMTCLILHLDSMNINAPSIINTDNK